MRVLLLFKNMNILYYGKNRYFIDELIKLGNSVFTVGENERCDFVLHGAMSANSIIAYCSSIGFEPDVFFYADDSTLPHIYKIEELAMPTIFFSMDTYCHFWHSDFSRAFDYCLYAQKEVADQFSNDFELFPLFSKYNKVIEPKEEWIKNRDIPVGFVGTIGHRNNSDRDTFYRLFRVFHPIIIVHGDYVPIYQRTKIVLNQTAVGEINFRTFEAMALGCCCLSDHVPTDKNAVGELFHFGVNSLPTFPKNDVPKAVDFCIHYLSKEKEEDLYAIAKAGNEYVLKYHTAMARAIRVNELFSCFIKEKIWRKRFEELAERKIKIKRAFYELSVHKDVLPVLQTIYSEICHKI